MDCALTPSDAIVVSGSEDGKLLLYNHKWFSFWFEFCILTHPLSPAAMHLQHATSKKQ